MSPTLASIFALILLAHVVIAVPPYFYDGYSDDFALEGPSDGGDRGGDQTLVHGMNKRSCIRRGGRCDWDFGAGQGGCCSGGACRCNLWGTNCQCQRMGIFQKWG